MGAKGAARTILPILPLDSSFPWSSTTRTSKPGMGLPALPGLICSGGCSFLPTLRSLPACGASAIPDIGEPDSELHQLSMTRAPAPSWEPYFFSRS